MSSGVGMVREGWWWVWRWSGYGGGSGRVGVVRGMGMCGRGGGETW